MRIIIPGHVYSVKNLEDTGEQTITFIRRNSEAVHHASEFTGTNVQEVLRVLIDRCEST